MRSSPICLFIYRRSENLVKIFNILREIGPTRLYVVADGPKDLSDKLQTDKTRKTLESLIDWPCEVKKNYAESNLGLKKRFASGINWVFKHTDRAIFIEDDCIPDPTFFRYCDELLEEYKNDARVFSVAGNNFQFGKNPVKSSYYFSKYPHVWGWATWKRSWDKYDSEISDWKSHRSTNWLADATGGYIISKFWKYIFDRLAADKINTWDYQLTYASFKVSGLNIIPSVNLVSNVGYGEYSTNIKKKNKTIAVPASSMKFPLVHPKDFTINKPADQTIENLVYLNPIGKISLLVKSILGIL